MTMMMRMHFSLFDFYSQQRKRCVPSRDDLPPPSSSHRDLSRSPDTISDSPSPPRVRRLLLKQNNQAKGPPKNLFAAYHPRAKARLRSTPYRAINGARDANPIRKQEQEKGNKILKIHHPGRKEEPLKSYKRTLGDKERKRRLGCRTFAAQQPNDVVIFVVVVGRRRRERMIPGMPGPNIHTHLEEPIPGLNLTSFISIIYELIL